MKRAVWVVVLAAFAGCKAFEKKPPPEMGGAPPEVAAEPEPEPKPEPGPQQPAPPPVLPGVWTSVRAAGPGSAGIVSITVDLGTDGAYAGSMLIERDAKRRFVVVEGAWARADDSITVAFPDGRRRTWTLRFDEQTLVLTDGESELRLAKR